MIYRTGIGQVTSEFSFSVQSERNLSSTGYSGGKMFSTLSDDASVRS